MRLFVQMISRVLGEQAPKVRSLDQVATEVHHVHVRIDDAGMAGVVRTGGLVLDAPGSHREVVLPLFDAAGVPYEEWDAATVAARVPGLDTGRFYPPRAVGDPRFWNPASGRLGGYYTPDAGFVDDPQLAAHNLMVAATAQGARFRFRTNVVEVVQESG